MKQLILTLMEETLSDIETSMAMRKKNAGSEVVAKYPATR